MGRLLNIVTPLHMLTKRDYVGRMMDDKIGAFRKTVPSIVHAAIADPRRR